MKTFALGLVTCALSVIACANEVIIEEAAPTPTGGNQTGTTGAGSSSTNSGTTTACVPADDVPVSSSPTCKDLDRIVLTNPLVEADSDVDGVLEPGETATLTVTMKDVSGLGFNWYPGVVFVSEDPALGVQADTWYYAILPCGELAATATIKASPDVKPGQTVSVRAHVDMLNANCAGTFALEVPIKIQ